jgi:hypothetical protein
MNWKFIRHHNAIMAARKARIAVAAPLQTKRWSAVDARRWILVTETPYEDQSIKRITLKVGDQEIVIADIEPVPPYRQSVNLFYSGFFVGDRDMTPAAFDALEDRVLTLAGIR